MLELLRRLPRPVKARLLRLAEGLGAWPQRVRGGPGRGLVLYAPLTRRQYVTGRHEEHVAEALWERLEAGRVALDAGAHLGYFTLLMARRVGAGGRVFGFEPQARLAGLARRSARRNRLPQVTVVEQGLGAAAGRARLVDGPTDAMAWLDTTSAAAPVGVTTLDGWAAGQRRLERVDLIKLDVEGAELETLAGGTGLLRRFQPQIVCEVHWSRGVGYRPRQLVDWLTGAGYAVRLLPGRDQPEVDLDDVLRRTEAVLAPEHMAVFHVLATRRVSPPR